MFVNQFVNTVKAINRYTDVNNCWTMWHVHKLKELQFVFISEPF